MSVANRFPGCLQPGPVQVAGPAYPVWSQPNTDPVGCRSASGKNSGHAVWKMELCHKDHRSRRSFSRPGRSEPKWPSKILTLADDGLNTKYQRTPRRQPKQQCNNNWIQVCILVLSRHRISHQSRQGTNIVVHF